MSAAKRSAKKSGVLDSINEFVIARSQDGKPFTHEDIRAELIRKFPDREPSGMMGTIKAHATPGEMAKLGYILARKNKQYTAHRAAPPHNFDPIGKEPGVVPQPAEKTKSYAPPSPIRLFRYTQDKAEELLGHAAQLESEIHKLMEEHMECFLGIRFIAREYSTGAKHGGRIDSLGLDKNNCPVIIEYKRHTNENVTNQALFYRNWLMEHKEAFQWQVLNSLKSQDIANAVNWNSIRLMCIAEDFTNYDKSTANVHKEINIELIRYKYYSDDMLMLEWIQP